MHVLPVHKQYIKYFSVLLAFYDSSMVKHREVRAVSFSKMKMNIVIFITTVNLFPAVCGLLTEGLFCKPYIRFFREALFHKGLHLHSA